MDNKFEPLSQEDVVSIEPRINILVSHQTFKVDECIRNLQRKISLTDEQRDKWFLGEGEVAEVLRPGSSGWQKGRIRISLEFCPEEPKSLSPLDGIEQQMDEFNP
ncbi:KGK domain-containing protein [Mastigocoleus testarum]|uniref:KGK domain-containing protein n=1 Tax=Mastigocoleus testarum BC008 TaxID=371196 RepID=A0A0V7ZHY3_9CYAN|nr:KGK domain-containing protein [Mastigocoleus testarum]KST63975.1 hypothetical protein BC008_39945 [Mastigocoleus testarum BC008]KST64685.1 hypothetical protein BC008_40920 [Mastigocoleus testarum BC008]